MNKESIESQLWIWYCFKACQGR